MKAAPPEKRNSGGTAMRSDARVRWSELLNRKYGSAVVLVCFGVWLHAADGLFVATMLPTIVPEIGGEAFVSWSVALYEVGSIVAAASSGLLTIKLGIKRPMILAACVFAFGCFASALAPNMAVMLAGRALQGAGGGGLVAMSFVAVAVLFPPRLVVRALAAIAALWGVSAFLGPLLGSLFVTHSDWRIGFAFFGAKACLLICWIALVPRVAGGAGTDRSGQRFPLMRLSLLCGAVLLVAVAGLEFDASTTPLLMVAGIAALSGFLILDGRREGNRLLPAMVYDIRRPANLTLALILLLHLATTGLATYGPFLMLAIHGTGAMTAGYAIACISIGWTVSAILVSGAPESRDLLFISAGVFMVALSVPGLLFSVQYGPVWLIFMFAALEGTGQGTSRSFLVRRAILLAGPNDKERISAAMPTLSRLGYALGAAISGMLANSAGFSVSADPVQAVRVARFIFMGSLPFAVLAVVALAFLVPMASGQSRQESDSG